MFKQLNLKLIVLIAFFGILITGSVYALNKFVFANSCDKTYGGGKECDRDLRINKVVSKDQEKLNKDKTYTDSVYLNANEQTKLITFKIKVENKGDVDENDLEVVDNLPSVFELVEGAKTEDIKTLDNGTEKVFYITVRVKKSAFESGNANCAINEVKLKKDNETVERDNAVVCFGTKLYQLPKTGSEDTIVYTIYGMGLIMAGIILKRIVA